ncbi:MAG: superfamily protein [Rhodopila sp.]|nr:superfamily protein [Rhodopila sp.]
MLRSDHIKVMPRAGHLRIPRLLIVVTMLCGMAGLRPAHADNTVTDWNNEFLLITQQTSGNLVAGPPDVAREIAQVGQAMSDAVNAASGSTLSSFAYTGGSVANANANVAAATAAYTALTSIFTDPAWQTPISTVTGSATPNNSNVNLANNIIIPELRSFLSTQLTSLGLASPGSCGSSTSSACLGYNLGIAAAKAVDNAPSTNPVTSGAVAAIQHGLLPNAPTGSGTTPGVYVPPSATGGRPEMMPTWGGTTPTGITTTQLAAARATVSGPPAINSQAYQQALLQTECQGSSVGLSNLPANIQTACAAAGYQQETNAQANAALFWNDPGTTIQPPGHWLQIADTVMTSQNSSLLQSAQLTALLGEAENDAGIAAWGIKYTQNLWRPVTAIQNCGAGGTAAGLVTWSTFFTTCDTSWASLIATPPHPDYVAGHPAFSGAAATVLTDFFGTDNIAFSSTSDYYCNGGTAQFDPATNLLVSCTLNNVVYSVSNPADCAVISNGIDSNGSPLICPITETFGSFSDASSGVNGAEFSRVVGGIHTPFSVEDALTIGNAIGADVMLDAPEPSSLAVCIVALLALTGLRQRRRVLPG